MMTSSGGKQVATRAEGSVYHMLSEPLLPAHKPVPSIVEVHDSNFQ